MAEIHDFFACYAAKDFPERKFLYIFPDQGGHGDDRSDYTDADTETEVLTGYLIAHGFTHIHLLYAASMGTCVALRLLQDTRFTFDQVHMDGTPLVKRAPLMNRIMTGSFLKARKACLQSEERRKNSSVHKMYGKEWGDRMAANFMKLSEASIRNICRACCTENCPENLSADLQRKIVFEWGEKDPDLRLSRKNIDNYFPESGVVLRKGYGHCGFMAAETEEYVKEVMGGGKYIIRHYYV